MYIAVFGYICMYVRQVWHLFELRNKTPLREREPTTTTKCFKFNSKLGDIFTCRQNVLPTDVSVVVAIAGSWVPRRRRWEAILSGAAPPARRGQARPGKARQPDKDPSFYCTHAYAFTNYILGIVSVLTE